MSAAIQQAAISYFGLPDGTQMVEGGPMGHFAFTVPLTEEHLRGIADRMKALSEQVASIPKTYQMPHESDQEFRQRTIDAAAKYQSSEKEITPPSQEELRGIWNAMPAKEQGIYGSFGVFARRVVNDTFCVPTQCPSGEGYQHG